MKEKSPAQVSVASPSAPVGVEHAEGHVALETTDLTLRPDVDVRVGLDALDEITGHAGTEVGTTDDDGHTTAGLGEEHGRLSGRVAPADHHDRR